MIAGLIRCLLPAWSHHRVLLACSGHKRHHIAHSSGIKIIFMINYALCMLISNRAIWLVAPHSRVWDNSYTVLPDPFFTCILGGWVTRLGQKVHKQDLQGQSHSLYIRMLVSFWQTGKTAMTFSIWKVYRSNKLSMTGSSVFMFVAHWQKSFLAICACYKHGIAHVIVL